MNGESPPNSPVFGANQRGRDFVVGDIHGQLAMIDALLAAVGFQPSQDRLFSVGDLIDRGSQSAEALDRFTGSEGYFAIRGNHEAMLIASDRTLADFQIWQRNGGSWARALTLAERQALATKAEQLPLTLTLELADGRRVGLVHAEVPYETSWDEACAAGMESEDLWDVDGLSIAASLIWGRRRFRYLDRLGGASIGHTISVSLLASVDVAAERVPGIDLVICGHSILMSGHPARLGNTLFIDTGAYEDAGRLTMVEPLTGLYWQCWRREGVLEVSAKPHSLPRCITTPRSPPAPR